MKSISAIISALKQKAKRLKKEIAALYFAYKDSRTPWQAKGMILITLCYLLSPVDLIPDFIPVLGYLDDLVIIPLLITLSIKLIPKQVMAESRAKAAKTPLSLKKKWWVAVVFVIIWLAVIWILLLEMSFLQY